MLEVKELTYAAIITISLPGVPEKATATVTLTPSDNIKSGSGEIKALRDCTLADLQEFADALEADVWQQYQSIKLSELADDDRAHVKITILNETGQPLAATADEWLSHAVILSTVEGLIAVTADQSDVESSPAAAPVAEPAPPRQKDQVPVPEAAATPAAELSEDSASPTQPQEAVETPADVVTPAQEVIDEAAIEETPPVVSEEPETEVTIVAPPVRELRIAGLRRPVGHRTSAAVDILINEPAFRDAQAHSLTSLDREVAGVLVGPRPEKQPDGRYVVHITDTVIAKHTRMHGASVTYTPESWRYIHDKLAERYPNEEAVIVGWYHTHPGFGIFLSGMDLFIHQNFFTQIWHVAYVLDPLARRSGFFSWNRQKTSVDRYDFPWPDWAAKSW
jgi:proteasome lid subunit RPN8/RPN11